MNELKHSIQNCKHRTGSHDYRVFHSGKIQHLLNVPVMKPTLVVVLEGLKTLGPQQDTQCPAGHFLFLGVSHGEEIRNIPIQSEYRALIIEFDEQDFSELTWPMDILIFSQPHRCVNGPVSSVMALCLKQYVDWADNAPTSLLSLRKREIINLLCQMGYPQLANIKQTRSTTSRVQSRLEAALPDTLSAEALCQELATSESSLRRQLKKEGTSLTSLRNQTRLSLGLGLLQTSRLPVSHVAERCGFQSASAFSQTFKAQFGLTPSALRHTIVANNQ